MPCVYSDAGFDPFRGESETTPLSTYDRVKSEIIQFTICYASSNDTHKVLLFQTFVSESSENGKEWCMYGE